MKVGENKVVSRFNGLVRDITEASTLPHSMMRIIRATSDPLSNVRDITRIIEHDPALASKLLKCANSVLHGIRTKIGTIHHAVSYLGYNQVRNLTVTASICDIFKQPCVVGTYDRRELWEHMVSVAITSKMIAEEFKVENPEEVFLAGLLHDIGIILEDQYMHAGFSTMMKNFPPDPDYTLCQAEREWFGFDHTTLGYMISKKWNLSEVVQKVIYLHHAESYCGVHAKSIACVELANVMVTTKGIRSVGIPIHYMSRSVLEHLGLKKDDIKHLVHRMSHRIDECYDLFTLVSDAA